MKYKKIPKSNNYFAGSDGNIYSNFRNKFKKLRKGIQSTGKYYFVNIVLNKKRITQRVHRLICITFNGNPPTNKHTCSHLDGNWKNNKPNNLLWETYSENHQRKKLHGTDDTGIKNSRAKINLSTLKKIRKMLLSKQYTHLEIGKKFNLNRVFITKIARGHRYKGQGY